MYTPWGIKNCTPLTGTITLQHKMWNSCCNARPQTSSLQTYGPLTVLTLTRSLPGQFFPECHPRVWFSFAEVPAGYVLWCRCTAELHVLNVEYTRQWHMTMHFNWRDNSSVAVNVLILCITGYVEYCSNVFIGNLLKLNADELKRLLIEAWLGIQQSVTNQAIDEWQVHLNACVKAKGKNFEDMLWCVVPQLSIICYETYIQLFFASQLLTSHDF